tara:strand:+ start:869 stop:1240 length:372 start_codon:yes stop_codon:yes gene_type:complete
MKNTIIKVVIFLIMQLTIDGLGADSLLKGSIQHAPNPFNLSSGTTVVYELTQAASIELMVYNQFGQRILMETYAAGTPGGQKNKNFVQINQRNFSGLGLSKGIYFYIVSSNGRVLGKGKMAIV